MSDEQTTGTATPEQAAKIELLSSLRQDVFHMLARINRCLQEKPECIAELTLAKRELQSARHWMGECLSFYPTGYRVTDNPTDPDSLSKPQ